MKLLYIFISSFLFTTTVMAQTPLTMTVAGTVVDNNGNPIPDVTILIQEKTSDRKSDAHGKYEFTAHENDVIIFRKPGFNTVILSAREANATTVKMPATLIEAGDDDDVYIPFGIRKRRNIAASISTVKTDNLLQIPLSTLNNVLAGRMPGLYVQQTGTRPGSDDATFLIRSRSSYNSGQAPLVLVDGVVRDFINMDLGEIESISVLKDAASLSWYGMNGANGVIYVTTKRGSASKTKVSFEAQGGVQMPMKDKMTRPLNAYDYATNYNQALINDGSNPQYDQAALDAYRDGTDPYLYPNVNYVDQFFKKAAPVQRYVATVTGGNSFVRYYTLLSFYDQGGLYNQSDNGQYNANTGYTRYNFRTNLDIHLTKNLDVSLDVGGRVEKLRYPFAGNGGFVSNLYSLPANAFPLKNADGTYGGSALFRNNPLAQMNNDGNITDLYRMLLATVNIRQKLDAIVPGLSANVFYTYDISGMYQSGYNETYEVYEPDGAGGYTRYGVAAPLTYKNTAFSNSVRGNEFWGGFDYDRDYDQHSVKFSTRFQTAVSASPGRLDNTRLNWANRLSYSYRQKYVVDLVAAYSGSQNFAPGKRWGWFPALSAGWIISEEKYLQKAAFLDFLKLRGSVGMVGNDGISTRRFAYNNYFNRSGTQYFFGTGYNTVPSSTEVELGNPHLTWERAFKVSAGFDARFFNQALQLSADYFHERRSRLLTSALLPQVIGQAVVDFNSGTAQFNGVEAEARFTKKLGKLTATLFGNFTYAKSKILEVNEEAGLPAYQSRKGHVIGSVGADNVRNFLIADGLFQSQAEIDAAPEQRFSGVVRPGDIRYRDINGDGVIDNFDFVMTDYSDIPKAYYGFGAEVAYQQLYLNFLFQGVYGRTISINDVVNSGSNSTGYVNQFSPDSWTASKTDALWPRMTIANRGNNTQNSTYWLRSGDYLRLKSVELGYNLPAKLVNSWGLTGCRIYLLGFNLLTFSRVNDLPIDPEIPTAGYGSNYPYLRTFSGGISLNF